MQTTPPGFDPNGQIIPLSWGLRISFDKAIDPSITFFTLDQSLLDGPDILSPSDWDVIQDWDKYAYVDFSNRVISMEVTSEQTEPYSIVRSMADVTVNNFDNYFTPNSGSPIDQFILPKRPTRILMGFGNTVLPQFVGLSEKIPEINNNSKTASFHFIDFLTIIFDREIGQTVMLTDSSTDEILDYLFQELGLLPSQYVLDHGFNRVPFFYVKKGAKAGGVIRELMEAEQGRLYMDELGVIRFKNRQNYDSTSVFTFNRSNTVNYESSTEDDIINFVRIEADVLAAQDEQSIWEMSSPVAVKAGETVDIWAELDAPALSVVTPIYSSETIAESHFISTVDSSGETAYTDIALDSISVFSEAVKLTFENTGATNAYVYTIDLWGEPVRIVDTITVEESDQTSIDNFEERKYELKTNYIQEENNAISKAIILVDDYKDYGSIVNIEVKPNPALQIGDTVTLDLDGYDGDYVITKMVNILGSTQQLTCKFKEPREYFILDVSLLDGPAVLAP